MKQSEIAALQEYLDPSLFDLFFSEVESVATVRVKDNKEKVASSSCTEFKKSTEEEIQYLQDLNVNSNTALSTQNWLRRFSKWADERNVIGAIEEIPKGQLDGVLQQFYADLRKKNGEEYEPESLKVMAASLDRCVKDKCGYSILKDKEFEVSRKVLNGKAINLQRKGKGKRPNRADIVSSNEEDILWQNVLGQDNPTSLNFTTFFSLDSTLAHGVGRSTTKCELRISS